MARYKCATILIIAICLCFFHLSSSLDTIIKGKKECPEGIHNITENVRRVLKGGGGGGGGGHGVSGGGHSFSGGRGFSGRNNGGDSSSSTIPGGVTAAGAAAAAGGGNSYRHRKKNSSSTCFGSNFLAISLLSVVLSSFVINSKYIIMIVYGIFSLGFFG